MVIAFLVVMIMVSSIVAGFLVYGMFLGMVRMSKLIAQGYRWLVT